MVTLGQDIRYGFRNLGRDPGFSLIVAAIVAIGVGANTAVFSILHAFLIRPLPYQCADRLVLLSQRNAKGQTRGLSYPDYLDCRRQAKCFDELGCYSTYYRGWTTARDDPSEEYATGEVSDGFFPVLSVRPLLGRLLSKEDEQQSAADVVVISHAFWQQHFGGDPQVVGKTIFQLGQMPYAVVGVLPSHFQYPPYGEEPVDLWVPAIIRKGDTSLTSRDNPLFRALGRLGGDVNIQHAQAELDVISARLAAEYPTVDAGWSAYAEPLQDHMARGKGQALVLMMGAVLLIFLIACTNLAALVFSRGVVREREIALRAALGAVRLRLIQQMLVESLILALLGGGLGVLGASWLVRSLPHTQMMASMLLPAHFFRLDLHVLGVALASSVLAISLFGLAPSIRCSGVNLTRVLASGGRSVLGSRDQNAVYTGLIGIEVALTIILLNAAGLMIRSFVNVVTTDVGFNAQGVLTMGVYLSGDGAKHRALLEQVKALPGVRHAALAFPLLGLTTAYVRVESEPVFSASEAAQADFTSASPGYFEAMGIHLLRGRFFDERDQTHSLPVAIVDETLAKRYWPAGNWIGRRIQVGKWDPNSPWVEVVGVVGHIKNHGAEGESRMQVYRPLFQSIHPNPRLVLRTQGSPAAYVAAVRRAVHQIDPVHPVTSVRALDQIVGGRSLMRNLITFLLAVFAGVALLFSGASLFAVTRYSVLRRTQEFGIRVALGATKTDVLALVLRRGLTPVVVGIAIGLGGMLAVARVLSSLLFQLSPWDPLTCVATSLLLAGVTMLACYSPARRALRIDSITALRCE